MYECIYKLSISTFEHILNSKGIELLKKKTLYSKHTIYHAEELIKPEFLNFYNIEWSLVHYFLKPDTQGLIHTDVSSDDHYCVWGLNWIVNGTSTMEYWNNSDLIKKEIPDTIDYRASHKRRYIFETKKEAEKTYLLTPGVYLVNASLPHRATGHGPRHSFILRAKKIYLKSWQFALDHFSNYIIPW